MTFINVEMAKTFKNGLSMSKRLVRNLVGVAIAPVPKKPAVKVEIQYFLPCLSELSYSDEAITFLCVYEDSKYRQMALIGFDT